MIKRFYAEAFLDNSHDLFQARKHANSDLDV